MTISSPPTRTGTGQALFPRLLAPWTLAGRVLRNRIVFAPMSVYYADEQGAVTPEMVEHYGRRAQGGAAMVITENFAVSAAGQQHPRQALLSESRHVAGAAALAREIRGAGSLAIAQIAHAGRYAGPWERYGEARRLAPSAVPFPLLGTDEVSPGEMTATEIAAVVDEFGQAAARAEAAGFDGIELHAAQGLLLSQFLSPRMNRRTDEYGATWDCRCKVLLDTLACVRRAVRDDFVVGVHLLADELLEGGWTGEDAVRLAPLLEASGADFVIPVAATYESGKASGQQDLMRRALFNVRYAAPMRRTVSIPVLANGRLGDPWVAEHVLEHDLADAVALGRPLFADPDWPLHLKRGTSSEIRVCACDPPTCQRTQLSGSTCHSWPPEARARGILGYDSPPG